MNGPMVLSLFPGLGFFDAAFEAEGFCVVRGPDVIWGGDIRAFHPPGEVFAGIIGGPPCQPFSSLVGIVRANGYEPRHTNLIPEFERVVSEASPSWFVMEEAVRAPVPAPHGYVVHNQLLDNRWLGEVQSRRRRISFGTREGLRLAIQPAALENAAFEFAVTAGPRHVHIKIGGSGKVKKSLDARRGKRLSIGDMLAYQGFPSGMLDECPLTVEGKRQAIGNGVPLPMGRAIAKAVKRAVCGEEAVA